MLKTHRSRIKTLVAVALLLVLPPVVFGLLPQAEPSGVAKVEFFLDGQLLQTVTTAPYEFQWDSTKVANGTHTLVAKATDNAGNVGVSETNTFTVANAAPVQDPPPTLYFLTKDGSSFSGATKVIDLHVADNIGVVRCELTVNNVIHADIRAVSLRLAATVKFYLQGILPKGTYTLSANCYDGAGGRGSAPAITVTKN